MPDIIVGQVDVPDLASVAADAMTDALAAVDLLLDLRRVPHGGTPGSFIDQTPAAGATADPGTSVIVRLVADAVGAVGGFWLDFAIGFGFGGGSVATATAPGVPAIGTATAGDTSASVTFTLPASNGGSAITGYTVTSSPGGITATGGASPITVPGLTNGTAYTFTVHATNAVGSSAESSASNSVTPTAGSSQSVYANGVQGSRWLSDLSFGNAPDYNDTTHPLGGHTKDLKIPVGGAWQPASSDYGGRNGGIGADFGVGPFGTDISAYTYLQFDLYTTAPTDLFDMQWHYDGDIPGGGGDVTTPTYIGSIAEIVGALSSGWNQNLKIPLAYGGNLGNVAAYKFFLRDNSNGADCFVDNVKFIPGSFSWIHSGGQARTFNSGTNSYARDASTLLNGWVDACSNASAIYSQSPAGLAVGASVTGVIDPGHSTTPTSVVKVTINANGGLWKVTHAGFAIGALDHFTFAALPTLSGYDYRVQFYDTSGTPVGNVVNPASYTNHDWGISSFWTVYSIPLSAFGSIGSSVGAVSIKDNSGRSSNTFYLSGIGLFN